MSTLLHVRRLCACVLTLLVMLALAMPLSAARAENSSGDSGVEYVSGPRVGSITLHLTSSGGSGVTLKGGQMSLYLVASVGGGDTGELTYDIANGQFPSSRSVQDIPSMTKKELDAQNADISKALVQEIVSGSISPLETVDIKDGVASFPSVEEGLYLLMQSKLSAGGRKVNAFLMSVPNEEGELNVEGNPKPGYSGIATATGEWDDDDEGVDMDKEGGDSGDNVGGGGVSSTSTSSVTTGVTDSSSLSRSALALSQTGDILVVFLPLALVGFVLILLGASGNKHSSRKA